MTSHRQFLTKISAIAVCGLTLLFAGCYIASVHPIAEPNQRIFDKELVGAWVNGHDTLRISGEAVDNLRFDVVEGPGPMSDSIRHGSLTLLLTNIADQTFMDVHPSELQDSDRPILEQMLLVPMHGVIRYAVHQDTLSIQYLNYSEFKQLSDSKKLHGLDVESVSDDGPIVISSSTATVRDFLADHRRDEQLYADPINYLRLK